MLKYVQVLPNQYDYKKSLSSGWSRQECRHLTNKPMTMFKHHSAEDTIHKQSKNIEEMRVEEVISIGECGGRTEKKNQFNIILKQ